MKKLIEALRAESLHILAANQWEYDTIKSAVAYGVATTLDNLADRLEKESGGDD